MKLHMFRTVRLSIIRSLFTVHSAMVYVIHIWRQLSSRSMCSCSKAIYKPVWQIPLLSVQWINSWWWVEELPETCRVSCRSKMGKLVILVGFIIKKIILYIWTWDPCKHEVDHKFFFLMKHLCLNIVFSFPGIFLFLLYWCAVYCDCWAHILAVPLPPT